MLLFTLMWIVRIISWIVNCLHIAKCTEYSWLQFYNLRGLGFIVKPHFKFSQRGSKARLFLERVNSTHLQHCVLCCIDDEYSMEELSRNLTLTISNRETPVCVISTTVFKDSTTKVLHLHVKEGCSSFKKIKTCQSKPIYKGNRAW